MQFKAKPNIEFLVFCDYCSAYGDKVPFLAMRTAMAVMGALVAPMAYITLRNKGQSAPTAILASLLVAFGNILQLSESCDAFVLLPSVIHGLTNHINCFLSRNR